MPRHEIDITIGPEGGRDAGKVFHLKEMPAFAAESWVHRVGVCLAHSGIDILDLVGLDLKEKEQSNALIAMFFSALRNLNYNEARPLLEEMMACVQIVPSAGVIRPLTGQDDVEELGTINRLRVEVFKLHLDFLQSAFPSKKSNSMETAQPLN